MIAHVVNLLRRPERKQRFLGWNAHHGIDFRFFAAIEGASLARDPLVAEGVLATASEPISNGALGNALSHRALWQACERSGEIGLIFEDDACLRSDFLRRYDDIMHQAGATWDILFFGYNTDSPVIIHTRERLWSMLMFGEDAKTTYGNFFEQYATAECDYGPSLVVDAALVWGTLGYAVSPRGARALLDHCFPLSTAKDVIMGINGKTVKALALDGMINAAMQGGLLEGKCCFPPLVLGPNEIQRSDVSLGA